MTQDLRDSEILGYRLVELIAEGGMGSVWRAEHPDLGKVRAIKLLKPHLAGDAEVRDRFRTEARIQMALGTHPHIVPVENLCMDPPAMVMEYIEGDTLAEVIGYKVGPIPHARALPWMKQILSALEYAHGQAEPVIHRDIKPSNIIVASSDNTAKVMDFGIAKVAQAVQLTQTGFALGTSAYMAPEQITGAGNVDQRADIYSLGVTFYEMLAGRPPFVWDGEGDSDYKLKLAHNLEAPPDPRTFYDHIPVTLVKVVMRCLEKAPADRYQTVAALRQALEGAWGGAAETRIERGAGPADPVAASPGQAAARGMASSRKSVFGLLALGLLVLLVGVVLAVRPKNNDGAAPEPAISGGSRPTGAAVSRAPDSRAEALEERSKEERGKQEQRKEDQAKEEQSSGGVQWVLIAGGSFMMGSHSSGVSDELPVHDVVVSAFYMSKSEVTVGQYRACVQRGPCAAPNTGSRCNWGRNGRDDHPINCVDWNQARSFCRWVGGRLASEAEWEYAARSGGRTWKYAWGNEDVTCSRAVIDEGGKGCGRDGTWPVCSKTAGNTSHGLCDMVGNVWEWVEDCWHGSYSGAPDDGSSWTSGCTRPPRIGRGGAWSSPLSYLRAANRSRYTPGSRFNRLGFRCAR